MEKLVSFVGTVVVAIFVTALSALFGGTLLWLIWPVAIPAALPGVVHHGYLAVRLSWWQAVTLVWACEVLIKVSVTKKER